MTNVSNSGVSLRVYGEELFMSHDEFPWFKDVWSVRFSTWKSPRRHLYWPDLDVDLGIETIRHPERTR